MSRFADVVQRLGAVIESRRDADPATSWSARLLGDRSLAAKKLAEEAVELALASVQDDRAGLVAESADMVYHWLIVLAGAGVPLDEVAQALEAREGRSGIEEKRSRGS
jgi:phosphoribosyl-ATP pyrophosphohydrolase